MKIKTVILIFAILFPCAIAAKERAKPVSVDTIQVIKIAAQDERAVIKAPDGKMQVIKVGDLIGDQGKVLEITGNRIVIEEKNNRETEKVIIRLIDGEQKIERLRKTREKPDPILAPAENQKMKKQIDRRD
ncbi:MAG TPA: hypothetical protein VIX18_07765 [Nitrospirota bacterium]